MERIEVEWRGERLNGEERGGMERRKVEWRGKRWKGRE